MPDISLKRFLQWNRFNSKVSLRHLLPSTSKGSIRYLVSMNFRYMDRLQPNQQLNINDQLVSNNERVNLNMQSNGNLVLYRTHFGQALWASNTCLPVDHVIMREDGVLSTCSPEGESYWETGTSGHPDSWAVLQDDGNFVIYDTTNNQLWTSNTVQNFSSPTFKYRDSRGYTYVETSEWWKDMCSVFPCFAAICWPGYDTKVIEDIIDGQHVVIQLWKGRCQKFLGMEDFPGGIGAEVGIYQRIPGKGRPTSFPFSLPPSIDNVWDFLSSLIDKELWWPFPELNTQIEFNLINPITNETFFSAGPENSYWLAKWMNEDSYKAYQQDQGKERIPSSVVDYILECKINGKNYRW